MKASRLQQSAVIGHIAVGSLEFCWPVSAVLLCSCCVDWDCTYVFTGFIPSSSEYIQKCIPPSIMAQQPPLGHGVLIIEVSRSHTTTHHSR